MSEIKLPYNNRSKEDIIASYIGNINFNENFNVKKIEQDLRVLLHETPAIKLEWTSESKVNEISGKSTRVEKLSAIKVVYTTYDREGKIAPQTLTFYDNYAV